jgi:capsid protein
VDEHGNPISSDAGRFAQEFGPGTTEVVPYGYELQMIDPQHPNTAMPDFLKWGLRSVSTGMGVSYNTLGSDAEGVNYTSLRFFLGVERDNWMETQDWYECDFIGPVYARWATAALQMGGLQARPGREDELHNIRWQPRRWEGPDPAKQAMADKTELANGTTTLTQIAARKGVDFDDLLAERVAELSKIKAAAEAAGLEMADILPALFAQRPEQEAPNNDDD